MVPTTVVRLRFLMVTSSRKSDGWALVGGRSHNSPSACRNAGLSRLADPLFAAPNINPKARPHRDNLHRRRIRQPIKTAGRVEVLRPRTTQQWRALRTNDEKNGRVTGEPLPWDRLAGIAEVGGRLDG